MARRHRKIRKLRGSRTHGWGTVGQHRKHGSRGGRGRAGRHKHKWTWVLRYAPDYWGKKGFKSRRARFRRVINVGELDALAEKLRNIGKLVVEDGKPVIDLASMGFEKLLGKGKVSNPLTIKALNATEPAVHKVKEAHGEVITVRARG